MKYNKKILSLTIIFILLFSTVIYADNDLSISNWNVNAVLKDNGDLQLTEDISYDFDSEFNGIFRNISLDKIDGIENLKIEEIKDNDIVNYESVSDASNGDSNVFTEEIDDNTLKLKLYTPSEYETKVFRFTYTLKNVAIKYNDTGELQYKFIDDYNTTFIKDFNIDITLPNEVNDLVKIFAHGPPNGVVSFKDDQTVNLHITDLESENMVEGRILFPVSFIENSTNIVDEDAFNNIILEEEEKIIKDAETERKRVEYEKRKQESLIKNQKTFDIISPIILALGAIFGVFGIKNTKNNTEVYERELGDDMLYLSPAVNSYLLSSSINANVLVASIYNIAYKGFLTIEEESVNNKKFIKKDIENFKLTLLDKDRSELESNEIHILDFLFNQVAHSNTVTLEEIYDYSKKHSFKISTFFSEWTQKSSNDLKNLGLKDDSKKGLGILTIIISTFFIPFAMMNFILANKTMYGIISIAAMIILFIIGILLINKKSDLGKLQYNKLKEFKNSINYNYLDIKNEEHLITAMTIGIPMEKLSNFKINFANNISTNSWIYWYFLMDSTGNNSFASSMYYSSGSGISGDIGSGGGFSSGGGGGAGGGSTGGF